MTPLTLATPPRPSKTSASGSPNWPARINVARHEMLTLIAEFDRLDGWAEAGFTSCVDWLAWRTGVTPTTARHQIRVAHAADRSAPHLRGHAAGSRLLHQGREITRVATPETEEELLEYARSGSAVQLRAFVRGWKRMEREGELSAEEVRHRSRKLSS